MRVHHVSVWLSFFCISIGAIILVCHELMLLPDGKLHVHFLDVGQGDSVFLISPSGKQILIDGGPDLSSLEHVGKFMPFLDRKIDILVLTHPHSDHISALPEILRRYDVKSVMLSHAEEMSGSYQLLLHELSVQKIPLIMPIPGQDVSLGDGVIMNVLWPPQSTRNDANNMSVVLRIYFGDSSLLLTGDIEEESETAILASGANIQSDILKVPHHGSRTSSSTGFLLAVNPSLAIVSAGADNSFGHPHPEITERYEALNIPLRSTQKEGNISFSFPSSKMGQTR